MLLGVHIAPVVCRARLRLGIIGTVGTVVTTRLVHSARPQHASSPRQILVPERA